MTRMWDVIGRERKTMVRHCHGRCRFDKEISRHRKRSLRTLLLLFAAALPPTPPLSLELFKEEMVLDAWCC